MLVWFLFYLTVTLFAFPAAYNHCINKQGRKAVHLLQLPILEDLTVV